MKHPRTRLGVSGACPGCMPSLVKERTSERPGAPWPRVLPPDGEVAVARARGGRGFSWRCQEVGCCLGCKDVRPFRYLYHEPTPGTGLAVPVVTRGVHYLSGALCGPGVRIPCGHDSVSVFGRRTGKGALFVHSWSTLGVSGGGWVLGVYPRPRLHFQPLYLQLHSPALPLLTNRRHLLSSPVNSFRPDVVSADQPVCRAWAWELLLLVLFVLSPWSPGISPHRGAPSLEVWVLWQMDPLTLCLGATDLGSV